MSHEPIYLEILEKISDLKSSNSRIEGELSGVKGDIQEIKKEDARQNELLAQHIAGVRTNRERLELEIKNRESALQKHEEASQKRYLDVEERLKIVEFVPNFLKASTKIILWTGSVAGALYGVARFFHLF